MIVLMLVLGAWRYYAKPPQLGEIVTGLLIITERCLNRAGAREPARYLSHPLFGADLQKPRPTGGAFLWVLS